jgi:hypothetical protein
LSAVKLKNNAAKKGAFMEILENVSALMTTLAPVIGGFVPFVLSLAVLTAFVVIGIALWRK